VKFKELNIAIHSSYNECLSEVNLKKKDNESDLKTNVKNLQKKYKKMLKEDNKNEGKSQLYEIFIKDLKKIS
tara:strand:- start:326 stop:541 length:216 start_codon:yes stop_codon:yes gene_type:complete